MELGIGYYGVLVATGLAQLRMTASAAFTSFAGACAAVAATATAATTTTSATLVGGPFWVARF